ncbi:MAG: hypothetical protein Q8939_19130 [Bacteroidota bacterium]|nr:hypothetical protein [Bacteroidota bacterium]
MRGSGPFKGFRCSNAAEKPLQNILKPGIIPFIEQLLIFVEIMPVVIAFENSLL